MSGPYSFEKIKSIIGNYANLPVLNLDPTIEHDYIDWIKPHHLSAPIMKFVDKWKREGIALRLRSVNTGHEGTLVFFQRHGPNSPDFCMACPNWRIKEELEEYHTSNSEFHSLQCDNCPFSKVGIEQTINSFFISSYQDVMKEPIDSKKPFVLELFDIVAEYVGFNSPIKIY